MRRDAGPSSVPRVSVLLPVHNGARYLAQAIESALAQRFRALELIIVDDGSDDHSHRVARRFLRADRRVRLLQQSNAGLPAARNAAIAQARGEYLALLDADDVWLPQHLALAVAVLDAEPEVGLVHADVQCIDADGAASGRYTRSWRRCRDPYRTLLLRHEHVCCPTAVFRRRCIDVVGDFDLRFTGLGCEDRDLWLRIAERFRLHFIDAVVAHYRVHAGGMSHNRERMVLARRALLDKLRGSPRAAPLLRHAEAMVESDLGMEFLAEGQTANALRAQLRALRIRPHTWRVWRRTLRPAFSMFSAVLLGL